MSLEGQNAPNKGQMEAMFDFIITEMDLYWLKSVPDMNWKNVTEPKTENSFWPANFVCVQVRHFFGMKVSEFLIFQTLQKEIGNYFLD